MASNKNPQANVNDIRDLLMEEVYKLREGSTSPANVNATCNAIGKVLSTVKLQMEYARLTGGKPDIALLGPEGNDNG